MTNPTTSYISPLILLANCMSFGITVTHFVCTTHRFTCSSKLTKKASPASCKALTAMLWNLKSGLISCIISFTNLWNGNLLTNYSVLVWYFFISFKALIPLFIFSPHLSSVPAPLHSFPSLLSFVPFSSPLSPSWHLLIWFSLFQHWSVLPLSFMSFLLTKQILFTLRYYLHPYTNTSCHQDICNKRNRSRT